MESIETEDGDVLASDVDVADGIFQRARGLMFRDEIPEDYALVFEFRRFQRVIFHMFFVRFPIDVVFLDPEYRVVDVATLSPWTGWTMAEAKRAVELPAGSASDLGEGEKLVFVEN